jgi:hypothetical protein
LLLKHTGRRKRILEEAQAFGAASGPDGSYDLAFVALDRHPDFWKFELRVAKDISVGYDELEVGLSKADIQARRQESFSLRRATSMQEIERLLGAVIDGVFDPDRSLQESRTWELGKVFGQNAVLTLEAPPCYDPTTLPAKPETARPKRSSRAK